MIRVLRPGLLTTVQDLGRTGLQQYGVVVGGAMDANALRIANLLVGNDENAAGLEATLLGPALLFERDTLVAVCGGDLLPVLDDSERPRAHPFLARSGSTLTFMPAREGARCCISFGGGINVPVVLDGRGTDLRSAFGGHEGRALVADDVLMLAQPSSELSRRIARAVARAPDATARWGAGPSLRHAPEPAPLIRILAGPEHDAFDEASRRALVESAFEVTTRSNRMGYRMHGATLTTSVPLEMVSSPVTMGTVQVPADGEPIILMADRQTTGGYPRIAQVISADTSRLAQVTPGRHIRFRWVTIEEAQAALLQQERDIRRLAAGVQLMADGAA